jgi:hypothetical protein
VSPGWTWYSCASCSACLALLFGPLRPAPPRWQVRLGPRGVHFSSFWHNVWKYLIT